MFDAPFDVDGGSTFFAISVVTMERVVCDCQVETWPQMCFTHQDNVENKAMRELLEFYTFISESVCISECQVLELQVDGTCGGLS